MDDHSNPRFSLGVSVLLDDMEADLSLFSSPRKAGWDLSADLSLLKSEFQDDRQPSRHSLVNHAGSHDSESTSSCQRLGHGAHCNLHYDEVFELQPARDPSMQMRNHACKVEVPSVDFDDEVDFQAARALSLQPRGIACAVVDEHSVLIDDEVDLQAARALLLKPCEIALVVDESGVGAAAVDGSLLDFDDEIEFQEARALSMQPREVACAGHGVAYEDSVLCFVDGFEDGEVELLVEGIAILKPQ